MYVIFGSGDHLMSVNGSYVGWDYCSSWSDGLDVIWCGVGVGIRCDQVLIIGSRIWDGGSGMWLVGARCSWVNEICCMGRCMGRCMGEWSVVQLVG